MKRFMETLQVSEENARLLTTIYLAFFNSGMMSIMLGALLPYIRAEYALDYVQSGWILSAHQIGNLCAVLLAGILPYLIGRKNSTLIMGSGIMIGMLLMTLTGNPLLLFVAFLFTGISRGTMSNICNSCVSEYAGNKTAGLNMLHAVYAIGALLSPVLLMLAVALPSIGWKGAPRFIALLAVVIFILLGRSSLSNTPTPRAAKQSATYFRSSSFWLHAGILFFYICAESTIIGWFVVYFRESGLLSQRLADLTPTLLWLMIMIGRFACAAISTRADKAKLLLCLGGAFALFFGLMLSSTTPTTCIIFLMLIGLSMGGIYPTTLASMQNTSSTLVTGTVIAFSNIGGILMPSIVGTVAEAKGIAGGISAVMAALFGMFALMIVKLVVSARAKKAS